MDRFVAAAEREPPLGLPQFDVVAGGYDMQAVDVVINRIVENLGVRSGQPAAGLVAGSEAPSPGSPSLVDASGTLQMRNNGGVHLDSKD